MSTGQCYNVYSIRMRKAPGVAQIIKQHVNHRVFTIHCFCHSFRLTCNDTIKSSAIMENLPETAFEIRKRVKVRPSRNSFSR